MEMSTFRGPSAEDHYHVSPTPGTSKTATSTTSILTNEDPVATRKCCTLCNLLVSRIISLIIHLKKHFIKQILLLVSF
jgi:hypothetical protein